MIPALLLLGLTALIAPSMGYSCYGDISALQAPMISCTSVRAPDCGLAMVRRTAEADIVRLRKYEIPIKRVARNLCLDPALIAAIISQESRVGLLLDNGWDQERQKYGLMQGGICTYRAKMDNLQVYEEDPCDRDNYYVNSVIRRAQYFKRHGF